MANDFEAMFNAADDEEPTTQPEPDKPTEKQPALKVKKKRGRPATGKRSDDGWISRAFFVEEITDIELEEEIRKLRREGVRMDKSDLVNSCLVAWLKWRKGEQPSKCLNEISSRRKDD